MRFIGSWGWREDGGGEAGGGKGFVRGLAW